MLVEGDAAAPKSLARFGGDEDAVESHARQHRADRQQCQRRQHRPRALVRMIAAGAGMHRMRVMGVGIVAGVFGRRIVVMRAVAVGVVDRMLDMLGGGPARLAPEGQEHQPPRIEAGQQRREHGDGEAEAADRAAADEGGFDDRVLRIETAKPSPAKPPIWMMPTPVIAKVPSSIAQKVNGISFRSAP